MKTSIVHSRTAYSLLRRRDGFTMVEIALCLAIIGFALVAIIGVLPAGLNVQKENREDTIINQDATVWLDAIRSGSLGYDDLTNYVDRIVVVNQVYLPDGNGVLQLQPNPGVILAQQPASPVPAEYSNARLVHLNSGAKIVGLLTTPKIQSVNPGLGYTNNVVVAFCRAISGSAVEKSPQQTDPEVTEQAFAYRMLVEVMPAESIQAPGVASPLVRRANLSDVRLLMRWPLKKPFSPAQSDPPVADASRMNIRSEISGVIAVGGVPDLQNSANIVPLYFLQPHTFR